jgi:hypothetical protein
LAVLLLVVAGPALGGENGVPAMGTAVGGGVLVDVLLGAGAVLVVLLASGGFFTILFLVWALGAIFGLGQSRGENFLPPVIKTQGSLCRRGFWAEFVQECLKDLFLPSQVGQ